VHSLIWAKSTNIAKSREESLREFMTSPNTSSALCKIVAAMNL
jgi:hypothetical protein